MYIENDSNCQYLLLTRPIHMGDRASDWNQTRDTELAGNIVTLRKASLVKTVSTHEEVWKILLTGTIIHPTFGREQRKMQKVL